MVLNYAGEVVGYTICNDMSSRSIEGQNPLYLPQAKIYLGGCALGPAIRPPGRCPTRTSLAIEMTIARDGAVAWAGAVEHVRPAPAHRRTRRLPVPRGRVPGRGVLSTGTSLVPDLPFTLQPGDEIRIHIAQIGELVNPVVRGKAALAGASRGHEVPA